MKVGDIVVFIRDGLICVDHINNLTDKEKNDPSTTPWDEIVSSGNDLLPKIKYLLVDSETGKVVEESFDKDEIVKMFDEQEGDQFHVEEQTI